jgi:hypothetical protein
MKNLFFLLLLFLPMALFGQTQLQFEEPVKQRVFVLTDITNEPDDQESLVRFLVYANEYDIEGLVATSSTHLREKVRTDKIEELVQSYGKVKQNLDVHADGYPSTDYLLSITKGHLPLFGMEGVGEDKDSPGSELLIQAVDKSDDRTLWVSVWGGANCLAQALWKVKQTRSDVEVERFVSKIKVYAIADQDDSGRWIRNTFPGIFYIVDATGSTYFEYYKATWTGISGDRFYKNGPMENFELVDNPWLRENIIDNHGPLGQQYLEATYIMEGDTPSFLGLINNGLAWYKSPAYGGWGGRYQLYQSYAEADKIWTSSVRTQDEIRLKDGKLDASNQATIWRWREAYQHDFAARMDWNVATDFTEANHNPVIKLNGNEGKSLATAKAAEGETVTLSANGSHDPDKDELSYNWFVYKEAGNFTGDVVLENPFEEEISFAMPKLSSGQELHIILEVKDNGTPSLSSYRRIVLSHP